MFKRSSCLVLFVACRAAVIDDARTDTATLALSVDTPFCRVASTTDDYPLTVHLDAPGKVTFEAYAADGTVRALARADVTAEDAATVTLPAGTLVPGTNKIVAWASGDKRIATSFSFTLDVRTPTSDADTTDLDGDCYTPRTGDCDENDNRTNPAAPEQCTDKIDNNCNGLLDIADAQCAGICTDNDRDTYAPSICGGTDCNDGDPSVHPGATEVCDGVDNDCDGKFDEDFDADSDLFVSCPNSLTTVDGKKCPAGFTTCSDCADNDNTTYPGAPEYCIVGDPVRHSCSATTPCTAPIVCALASRVPTGPVIFFSDIISGPKTGGEGGNGVFITLYGLRFGATRGTSTVKIGGVEVAAYKSWGVAGVARGLETIVIQPGGLVPDGDQKITVSVGGVDSNELPFTIRSGNIFFVDLNSGTPGTGTAALPFRSLPEARAQVVAGDTVYVTAKTGSFTGLDPAGTCENFVLPVASAAKGSAAMPIAYIGYPGKRPTIGGTNGVNAGCNPDTSKPDPKPDLPNPYNQSHAAIRIDSQVTNYVIANFDFVTTYNPIAAGGEGRRFINNTVIGLQQTDNYNAFDLTYDGGSQVKMFGNLVKNSLCNGFFASGSGSTDVEIAWNETSNIEGRGIVANGYQYQANSNITVHDNLLRGLLSGVEIGDLDGTTVGTAAADGAHVYNNIIDVAASMNYGIFIGESNAQSFAVIEHNTVYATSALPLIVVRLSFGTGDPGRFVFRDNVMITVSPSGSYFNFAKFGSGAYIGDTKAHAAFTGDHNLYSSLTGVWTPDTAGTAVFGMPGIDRLNGFKPTAGSPAINGAGTTDVCADYYGVVRPQSSAEDIGAVELP